MFGAFPSAAARLMIVLAMDCHIAGRTTSRARAHRFAPLLACLAACSPDGVSSETEASTTEASTTEAPGSSTIAPTTNPDDTTGTSSSSSDSGSSDAATTEVVPVCGNDLLEVNEQCDGTDLAGVTCMTLFGYEGELSCTDTCMLELGGCIPPG